MTGLEEAVFQRQAPALSAWLAREYQRQFGDSPEELWEVWYQMWWAVATLGCYTLWRARWQCLDSGKMHPTATAARTTLRGIQDHLEGVAASMRRRPATRIAGILMARVLELMARHPRLSTGDAGVLLLTFDGGARAQGASGGGWTLSSGGSMVACGWNA